MRELVLPACNYFGEGSINSLSQVVSRFSGKKGLIITDGTLYKLGYADQISDILSKDGIDSVVYSGVCPNPTKENVYEALKVYKENRCDFIVGLGGGSPNDCSKAVGILTTNGGKIEDYAGGNKSKNPSCPLITINTTAGTASEVSRAYLISDEEKQEKIITKDLHALPYASFNDPMLMIGLPASVTAMTGMDALSHAVESYVANGAYVLSRELALGACRLVFSSLREVLKEPKSIELRDRMIYAQSLAGIAFGNSGVGIDHSLSHALGATCHLPHGLCCALFLPEVIKFNCTDSKTMSTYGELSRALFPFKCQGKTDAQCAKIFIEEVEQLSKDVGTNKKLSELGCVERSMFDSIIDKALRDGNTPRNPVQPTSEDLRKILEALW
ncbi:MAG: iron-containing alcohol dehydrogenase [Sphaerochaetaceae bacterium]|nr:iron-containing alcohol dehydrogenase [Sphaerochaetaceae bacterium]